MTWVRFTLMVESMPTILRIAARAPRPPEEEFRDAREGNDKSLPADPRL